MKGCSAKRRCVEVRHEMKYVPLLLTLERLLQNKHVLLEVLYILVIQNKILNNYYLFR